MRKLYFVIWTLIFSVTAFSQEKSKIDSLRKLIEQEKDIVKKTDNLYKLGELYENTQFDSALYWYAVARDFAQKNDFAFGEARYASFAIVILNKEGKFAEAFALTQDALEKYKKLDSPKDLATAYLNLGRQSRYFSDFESTINYYLEAKKIGDSIQDEITQRTVNNNLCATFFELKEYEKSKMYGEEALKIAENMGDDLKMIAPLYNLAEVEISENHFEKALEYIDRLEKIALKSKDPYEIVDTYLIKGNCLGKMNLNQGIQYLNLAISEARKHDFPESEYYAYLCLGEIYLYHKKYREAAENLEKGIPLAKELDSKYELADFHKKASEAYENLGDFKKALEHNREYEKLNSEVQLEENKNRMLGLEAKYQFEKNEAEIKALNAEKEANTLKIRQKNSINFALAALLLVGGIIGFLLYKNYKNKQKIQAQRITELETEKQLSATQALLQGQENERSRMAKELHDGLGGLLSGVKLNLNNMHKKLIITEEDGTAFEKSIHLLDKSISELRRVAHNLMPESILKFGLDGAIKEFLQSIQNENMNIVYQSYHIENGLGKQLDISVYRIIQELVNNAIKHSEANEILVQIRKDENLLILDVEDNGKGFDINSTNKESGMGLNGIQSRVNYWKGKLEIDSDQNSGTAVHIEIPNKV